VLNAVVLDHMAPAAAAALWAEQLLKPFMAQHQHRVGLNHQAGPLVGHAPLLKLLRAQQVQKILLAVAFDALFWVGGAKQFTPARALPRFGRYITHKS
jgi:hypothetical protein